MKKFKNSDTDNINTRINYLQETLENTIILFNVLRNELINDMKEIKTSLKDKNIIQ